MKNFGFGFMRLPMIKEEVDIEQTQKMVDLFMSKGFTYFDTAHVYIQGKSEIALRETLVKKYPRDSFTIADKLSPSNFEKEEDLMPLFNSQLEALGVTYIDYYLMHAQQRNNYDQYQRCHAYEFAQSLKERGLIKHLGISFHDSPEFLDKILTEHPEIEFVQIQFNYLDYDNPMVESRRCYDVCVKHNKDVVIMEPIKGGRLINLIKEADDVFRSANGGSNASYALRFAGSFEKVVMILSGMSRLSDMEDNISFMEDFKALSKEEFDLVWKVKDIITSHKEIDCTGCRYCVDGCPKHILIPDHFLNYNTYVQLGNWSCYDKYKELNKDGHFSPNECIKCGLCEKACPQHLKIRDLLVEVIEKLK